MTITKRSLAALAAVVALAALALLVPRASAITNGEPDGSGHPNVGALLWRTPESDGEYLLGCSGSLLAKGAFLTAAHCVIAAEPGDLAVTFDTDLLFTDETTEWGPIVAPDHTIAVTSIALHPGFWMPPSGARSRNDVAVLTLDEDVSGTAAVRLPPTGYLASQAANGGLVGSSLENVGYGLQRYGWRNPTIWPLFDGLRRVSTSAYLGLTKDHLLYLMNSAAGSGGICVFDSGGPQFLNGIEVSLSTGIGAAPCSVGAIGASQRLDLPEVLEFLEPWTK